MKRERYVLNLYFFTSWGRGPGEGACSLSWPPQAVDPIFFCVRPHLDTVPAVAAQFPLTSQPNA